MTAARAAAAIALALPALAGLAAPARAAGPSPSPAAGDPETRARPRHDPHTDYMLQCQGCHLADGTGRPDAVPSLVDGLGRFLATPAGREFLVRVPGSATSPLGDAALAAVLNWMIRRFDPAAAGRFPPFTAAEVGRVRHPALDDVRGARRALLGGGPRPAAESPSDPAQDGSAPSR